MKRRSSARCRRSGSPAPRSTSSTRSRCSPESPLWDMENVIVSPHISGGTEIYNERAVEIFAGNLRRYLDGDQLLNVVDPARGY